MQSADSAELEAQRFEGLQVMSVSFDALQAFIGGEIDWKRGARSQRG
jgi:hypothetical protein